MRDLATRMEISPATIHALHAISVGMRKVTRCTYVYATRTSIDTVKLVHALSEECTDPHSSVWVVPWLCDLHIPTRPLLQ